MLSNLRLVYCLYYLKFRLASQEIFPIFTNLASAACDWISIVGLRCFDTFFFTPLARGGKMPTSNASDLLSYVASGKFISWYPMLCGNKMHKKPGPTIKMLVAGMTLLAMQISCTTARMRFGGKTPEMTKPPADATLYAQQSLLYPILEKCENFIVLCDFENPEQVEYFKLQPAPDDETSIAVTASSAATGQGALGVHLPGSGDSSLLFTPNIKNWQEMNLLLVAIYSPESQLTCRIELTGAGGNAFRRSCLLDEGWNKLKIDLADGQLGLSKVQQAKFTFDTSHPTDILLDDIILVRDRQVLLGEPDGPEGSTYVVREGKHYRIGSPGRFELTFLNGQITAWHDLASDPNKRTNLAWQGGMGPFIYDILPDGTHRMLPADQTVVSVRTRLLAKAGSNSVVLAADTFFGVENPSGRAADQQLIYMISEEGRARLQVKLPGPARPIGLEFALADRQGFNPIIGKIGNPTKRDADSKIEFALARRLGAKAGADFLSVFCPQGSGGKPVASKFLTENGSIRVQFEGETGADALLGLMQIWPTNIDTVADAEPYVRAFIAQPKLGLVTGIPAGEPATWSPNWKINE
jgi:hypothetical protein